MADEIVHQPDASRWVLLRDGGIASVLDYADDGRTVSMTRTFTNHPFRRQGLADRIVAAAVADADAQGRRVRPMCWFVAEWFEQHPDQAHLLA